ncbi:hypothetical protein H2203_009199 [Taxawa tesnikishii (nom. ined.)]|nr:hypothetical protein H2203_009199 [Dothideales sp. JES 119]
MQCTRRLLAPPGFWKRSLDEFKRLSNIAIKMETLHVPTRPYPLINFNDPDSIAMCKTMSDRDMGGFSKVSLTHHAAAASEPAHAQFSGSISIELPPNRPEVQRSGYAAFRTRDRPPTLFGKSLWDIDPYSYLALRVKADGRKYFINIQTESIVPTDIHQHRLYTTRDGEWETVVVAFRDFVRTNYGMVVEPQAEMMRQRVRSVGIGLIDRIPGPFDLRIAEIYATNDGEGKNVGKGRMMRTWICLGIWERGTRKGERMSRRRY